VQLTGLNLLKSVKNHKSKRSTDPTADCNFDEYGKVSDSILLLTRKKSILNCILLVSAVFIVFLLQPLGWWWMGNCAGNRSSNKFDEINKYWYSHIHFCRCSHFNKSVIQSFKHQSTRLYSNIWFFSFALLSFIPKIDLFFAFSFPRPRSWNEHFVVRNSCDFLNFIKLQLKVPLLLALITTFIVRLNLQRANRKVRIFT
jgi:hypothetical protein